MDLLSWRLRSIFFSFSDSTSCSSVATAWKTRRGSLAVVVNIPRRADTVRFVVGSTTNPQRAGDGDQLLRVRPTTAPVGPRYLISRWTRS